jgi:PII-like signaling protein
VNGDGLKLTAYFGERDRVGGGFLADAYLEILGRHRLQASLLVRGAEGFGIKHHLRSDRLLTLSEDLPVVAVAVDTTARIQNALPEVERLQFDGLVTLERAQMLIGARDAALGGAGEAAKLTVYLGRHERVEGRPGYAAIVELLHRRGLAAASVLLGVDGTVGGTRHRAKFFSGNANVPLMILAVGRTDRVSGLLPELTAIVPEPLLTVERVRMCKREGRRLEEPHDRAAARGAGATLWQKLTVHADESSEHRGRPQHLELIRALRAAGARGATTLRGVWGFHGDHDPHGDSFWQLRRQVPMMTVVIDAPERMPELFAIVDELTVEAGVVTSELIPAFRATGPGVHVGALRLAEM